MRARHDVHGRCRKALVLLAATCCLAASPRLQGAPRNFGPAASGSTPSRGGWVQGVHERQPATYAKQRGTARSYGPADFTAPRLAPAAPLQPPETPQDEPPAAAMVPQPAGGGARSSTQIELVSHAAAPLAASSNGPGSAPYVAARLPWYAPSLRRWAYVWPHWFYAWRYGSLAPWAYGPWAYRYLPYRYGPYLAYRLGGYSPWIAGGWGYGSALIVGPYYRLYGPWEVPGVWLGNAIPGMWVPPCCGCVCCCDPASGACRYGAAQSGQTPPPADGGAAGCGCAAAPPSTPNPQPATEGASGSVPSGSGPACYFW
jgi:hypothetical protein